MAEVYKAPELCNYYCSHECPIGRKYVPPIEMTELPAIILETVASLNAVYPLTNRLIEISRDETDLSRTRALISPISRKISRKSRWPSKPCSSGWKKKCKKLTPKSQLFLSERSESSA